MDSNQHEIVLPKRVLIVDDDRSLVVALSRLCELIGVEVVSFCCAEELICRSYEADFAENLRDACALVDMNLPGADGLVVQHRLRELIPHAAVVFMSGRPDISKLNSAWREGAVDFLFKPFTSDDLRSALVKALRQSRWVEKVLSEKSPEDLSGELKVLTAREKEILIYVANGFRNVEIGSALGISLRTVKMHRSNLMRKLQCERVADLVRFYERVRRDL